MDRKERSLVLVRQSPQFPRAADRSIREVFGGTIRACLRDAALFLFGLPPPTALAPGAGPGARPSEWTWHRFCAPCLRLWPAGVPGGFHRGRRCASFRRLGFAIRSAAGENRRRRGDALPAPGGDAAV